VGIEGSDYSKCMRRAEWATIPNYLFTADITEPFQVMVQTGPSQPELLRFQVVTCSEVLEHIQKDKIPVVLQNMEKHLAPGGILVLSISPKEETIGGVVLHQTVESQDWWLAELKRHGFEDHLGLQNYFGRDWVRGPHNAKDSFNVVLTRRGDRLAFEERLKQPLPEALAGGDRIEGLVEKSEYKAALPLLEEAMAANPTNARWHFLTAFCLHKQNEQLETALDCYGKALAGGYDEFCVRLHRGVLLCDLKQLKAAQQDLERAVQIEPADVAAREMLGRCHYEMAAEQPEPGQTPAATLAHLDKAVASGYGEFWARFRRGLVREQLGESHGACEDLKRATELDPAHPDARHHYERVRSLLGR